jgi:hypothetical protein
VGVDRKAIFLASLVGCSIGVGRRVLLQVQMRVGWNEESPRRQKFEC